MMKLVLSVPYLCQKVLGSLDIPYWNSARKWGYRIEHPALVRLWTCLARF